MRSFKISNSYRETIENDLPLLEEALRELLITGKTIIPSKYLPYLSVDCGRSDQFMNYNITFEGWLIDIWAVIYEKGNDYVWDYVLFKDTDNMSSPLASRRAQKPIFITGYRQELEKIGNILKNYDK